jgi:hypothetical protein
MAHFAAISLPCDRDGCDARATKEVWTRKTLVGRYCRHCAQVVHHETERGEAKADRRERAATGSLPILTTTEGDVP